MSLEEKWVAGCRRFQHVVKPYQTELPVTPVGVFQAKIRECLIERIRAYEPSCFSN